MREDLILTDNEPWPGLLSYSSQNSYYFFGREVATKKLGLLIENNSVTILSGKSGIGKSSLIHAGLIPTLKKKYIIPISIRMASHFGDDGTELLTKIKKSISDQLKSVDTSIKEISNQSLWEYFHTEKILNGFATPLIIFDQFEEIFTIGKNYPTQTSNFLRELSNIIENEIPLELQKDEALFNKFNSFSGTPVKFLISVREDFLPNLEDLNDLIPSIKKSRIRLTELSKEAALEVVQNGGKKIIHSNVSTQLLQKISIESYQEEKKYKTSDYDKYEPFLLNLICYQINKQRIRQQKKIIDQQLVDQLNIRDIIQDFYTQSTTSLSKKTKNFVETQLITHDGYRKLIPKDDAVNGLNIPEIEINNLIDSRILRVELWNGREQLELIHDVLLPVIREKKEALMQEEIRKQVNTKFRRAFFRGLLFIAILGIISAFVIKDQNEKLIRQNCDILIREADNRISSDPYNSYRLAEKAYTADPNYYSCEKSVIHTFNTIDTFGIFLDNYNRRQNGLRTLIEYSPIEETILTYSSDSTLRLFNYLGEGVENVNLFKQDGLVFHASYSNDGQKIVTASFDSTSRVLDKNLNQIQQLDHNSRVSYAQFGLDNEQVFTSDFSGNINIWNNSGEIDRQYTSNDGSPIIKFAMSPNGKVIIPCGQSSETSIWEWETNNKWPIKHKAPIINANFSSEGTMIGTASLDSTAIIWDLEGQSLMTLPHEGGVNNVIFSKDNLTIVTISEDFTAKIWDNNGGLIKTLQHEGPVKWVEFSPDQKLIVTAAFDDKIRVWDRNIGDLLLEFNMEDWVYTAKFSPKGNIITGSTIFGMTRVYSIEPNYIINIINDKKVFGDIPELNDRVLDDIGIIRPWWTSFFN